jgi:hypothetical protein
VMPPLADRELQSEADGNSAVTDEQVEQGDSAGSQPLQTIAPPTVEPLPSSQRPATPTAAAPGSTQNGQQGLPATNPEQSRADVPQRVETKRAPVVPVPPIRQQQIEQPARTQVEQSATDAAGSSAPAVSSPQPASAGAVRPVVIEFDKDSYVTSEGDGSVRLIVRRTGSARRDVSFTWNLRSNSAEMGSDFAGIGPGTERIPAGVREASITIPLVQDSIKETTELFLVELQVNEEGVTLGERSSAAVIIVDDD